VNEALCDGQNQGWNRAGRLPEPGGRHEVSRHGRPRRNTRRPSRARSITRRRIRKAFELLPPDIAKLMPTHPDNEKVCAHGQLRMVADNTAQVQRRFEQWCSRKRH